MAEKIGVVINSDLNGLARILTDRSGGCGSCHSGSNGCRSCLAGAKLESLAINTVGARNGDLVKLTLPSSAMFKGLALLYLLPIAALIAGAFGGVWIGGLLAWAESTGAVLGSVIGLVLSLWVVVRLGRSPLLIRQMTPTIKGIVQRAIAPQAGKTNTPHPKSCCG